jgi:hypothetical protein
MSNRKKPCLVFSAAMLLAGWVVPAGAQVTCNLTTSTPRLARTAGNTEPVGDILLTCTGGTPTPAGLLVPQINLTLFLSTNLTSLVTEHNPAGLDFSEALLLVDEPNQGINGNPATPLLNCGNIGAPDNGILGPGVCDITSTGDPTQTYDGTQFVPFSNCAVIGATFVGIANYGCGRPNAFQGFVAASPEVDNIVNFLGVPFDPPGPGGTRILRITNIRANAAALGGGGPHAINADVAVSGSTAMTITPASLTVAFSEDGLIVSALPGFVHLEEGFASAWEYKNIAFALANATPVSLLPYPYIVGDTNYPVDAAQNIPGVLFNTEDGFQWQNNGVNAPPVPNPPLGYAPLLSTAANFPLFSAGYGGVNTGISSDGVASAGTRIALIFKALGETVTVPNVVYLQLAGSPSVITGVMVATVTDANGAGVFTPAPGATTTIHNFGEVVYEVLYSNQFVLEFANVPVSISGPLHEALALPLLAPFYIAPAAGFETPTTAHPAPTAIPRFAVVDPKVILVKSAPGALVP